MIRARDPLWPAAGVALLLVGAPMWTAVAAAPAPDEQEGAVTLEMAALLRATRAADAPPTETTVEALATLGDAFVAPALNVLATRNIPTIDGGEGQVLNRFQQQMLLDALATRSPALVRGLLEPWRAPDASVPERAAGLRVLGAVGSAVDVATMLELARPDGPDELDARIETALRDSLTALVMRDAAAIAELGARRGSLATQWMQPIVLALGDADEPLAVDLLVALMRAKPDLVAPVAAQIVDLGPSPSADVNRDAAAQFIEHLRAGRSGSCATVALALGSLEAPGAVPELIVLLDAESRGTRENALVALRQLSGLGFAASSDLWRMWFQDEANWYHSRAPKLLREIDSPYVPRVTTALREISQRRLYRHELAARVEFSLTHPAPEVRAMTCRTLAELGSKHSVPSLIEVLEDREATVRQASCDALRVLTGLDHAADSPAWRELSSARG